MTRLLALTTAFAGDDEIHSITIEGDELRISLRDGDRASHIALTLPLPLFDAIAAEVARYRRLAAAATEAP